MKTQYDTEQAAAAALKTAEGRSYELAAQLNALRAFPETLSIRMPKIRALLSELTQRVHEFNAYSNVARGPGVEAIQQEA